MMLGENIQTTMVTLASRPGLDVLFDAARSLQGVIDGERPHLSLVVSGTRVPLPETTSLVTGQRVRVDVSETPQGLQLRITPREQPAQPVAPRANPLANLAAQAFESLGVPMAPEEAVYLAPPQIPPTESVMRAAVSTFTTRGTLGDDLQQIAGILTQATASGALPQNLGTEATALLSRVLLADPKVLPRLLEQSAEGAAKTVESRLAELIATGKPVNLADIVQSDVRGMVSRFRHYEPLVQHLRQSGQWNTFEASAQRVLDRLSAAHLQNLRGVEHPYLFLELPVASDSGLHHVQVHFIGDDREHRRGLETRNILVALDVSTTKLGDLWATLQSSGRTCVCRFRGTDENTADAIREASAELESALERVGFDQPVVHVALWDGNRVQEVARLLRPFSGIDLSA